MKIKAFSKEGLQAPQKDNPQERAKTEMRDKINGHVEQLETQVGISHTASLPRYTLPHRSLSGKRRLALHTPSFCWHA